MGNRIRAFVDRVEESRTPAGVHSIATLMIAQGEAFLSIQLPLSLLPKGTKEGEWLQITFEPDADSQQETQRRVEELLQELSSGK